MAGKSFKGNLEILNLSDIFQSLAMNRHSGTLIVTDGKREKKIFFAEGEITLLSSSRRQRLGDMLVASGKITEDDLDLALKLQKQSRKRLGEILVEEGFCEEEDIYHIVHQQIEEEIYDLFLWRKAEFEFIADQMPEDMARESPNLTRLNLNTNSLIMEALRRLDEWNLIRDLVPSTKDVFHIVDPSAVGGADIPDRIKNDVQWIDGKTTVEGLAEKFFVSDFELSKHLAELVQRGAVQLYGPDELAERAEEAYALNDFAAAAALYGRLAEHQAENPKILTPLADSLKRTGAEKQALTVYDELARLLEEKGGKEHDRLRQCYEAITQLDPSRQDAARKLEDLDLRVVASQRSFPILPVLVALFILAGGAAGVAWLLNQKPEDGADEEQRAQALYEEMVRARNEDKYREWFDKALVIWSDYSHTQAYTRVELPILVDTTPAGFEVEVNGLHQGLTKAEGPLPCSYAPSGFVRVVVRTPRRPGQPQKVLWETQINEAKEWQGIIPVEIVDKPDVSIVVDGWAQAGCVYSGLLDAYLAPCRDGILRAFRIVDGQKHLLAGWDKLRLSQSGDIFSRPRLALLGEGQERLFVGATEYGVLAVDLGGEPAVIDDGYRAPDPVWAAPLVISAEAVQDGRVIFGTTGGDVFAYPINGAEEPVWVQQHWVHPDHRPRDPGPRSYEGPEGAVRQAPAYLPEVGLCVFDGGDASLYAFDVVTGARRWRHELPAHPVGPPLAIGGRAVLVQLEGGKLSLLDEEGQPLPSSYTDVRGERLRVVPSESGDELFVAAADGRIQALDARSLRPLWKKEVTFPTQRLPRMAQQGERLLLAIDHPNQNARGEPEMFAVEVESGLLVWQALFPEGRGHVVSPLSVIGDRVLVGTTGNYLHIYDREY